MRFKKRVALGFLCFLSGASFVGCVTPKNHDVPPAEQFSGYQIIDAVDRNTVSVRVYKNDKIAILVRDIATTSYSYLEPRYMNSMATFEGLSSCCKPNQTLLGNTGLAVYQFSLIGVGDTKIQLVARHKGLSQTANHLDDDQVTTINVKVTKQYFEKNSQE